jgi:hypothetical protein
MTVPCDAPALIGVQSFVRSPTRTLGLGHGEVDALRLRGASERLAASARPSPAVTDRHLKVCATLGDLAIDIVGRGLGAEHVLAAQGLLVARIDDRAQREPATIDGLAEQATPNLSALELHDPAHLTWATEDAHRSALHVGEARAGDPQLGARRPLDRARNGATGRIRPSPSLNVTGRYSRAAMAPVDSSTTSVGASTIARNPSGWSADTSRS